MNLKEIAKIAGVSPACISLVRNGRPGVGHETRLNIQKLLYQYGYSYKDYEKESIFFTNDARESAPLTHCIRLLKYRKHAMLVDGNEGFVSSIIEATEAEAQAHGYHVITSTCGPENREEVIGAIAAQPMDGVLVVATEMEQEDFACLKAIRAPLLILDSDFNSAPYSAVTMNNRAIAYTAFQKLYERGHRRIGYLCSSVTTGNFFGRREGYMDALKSVGQDYDERIVFAVRPTVNEAYLDMKNHLTRRSGLPTAFFADNDTIAIGVMKALQESGFRIPQDVSIIGVDDIPFGRIASPPLNTMAISCLAIGQWAVRILIQRINTPSMPEIKMQVGAEYIERQSVRGV